MLKYPGIKITLGGVSLSKLDNQNLGDFLNLCSKLGVAEIDSSPHYGDLEKKLGDLSLGSTWKINSKVSDKNHMDLPLQGISDQVNSSLKKVNVKNFNIIFLHSIPFNKIRDKDIQEFIGLKENKITKKIGYSTSGNLIDLKEAIKLGIFDSFQVTHSCIDINPLYKVLADSNFEIYIKRALGSGILKTSHVRHFKTFLKKNFFRVDKDSYDFRLLELFGLKISHNNLESMFLNFSRLTLPKAKLIIGTQNIKHLESLMRLSEVYDERQQKDDMMNFIEKYWLASEKFNWSNFR